MVAGACGLFTLLLVVKQFRGPDSSAPPTPSDSVESLAPASRTERGGWVAREDAHSGATAGARRSASGGENRDPQGGLAEGGHDSAFERRGVDRGTWVTGDGLGSNLEPRSAASAPIAVEADVPAVSGAVSSLGQASRGTREQKGPQDNQLVQKNDKPADAAAEDPNAPVLSLPFDKSTAPDKGDQPAVNENVACGGVGEGCVFDTNSRLAIPDAGNLTGEAGSISFCLQPQWGGNDISNAGLVDLETPNVWGNRLKIFKNREYFRFSIWPNSGAESGVSAGISGWQPGQWHPVTVTFGPDPNTGVNTASMYLDGALVGQQPYDGQFDVPQQPLYIGSGLPGGEPAAGGALKSFQAYNRVLPPDEAANFAAGCPQ
jgi:hypothetical protein